MREVIGGMTANMAPIQFLNTHRRCDEMLVWLRRNNLTGQAFNTWFNGDMNGSFLRMVAELDRRIKRVTDAQVVRRRDLT